MLGFLRKQPDQEAENSRSTKFHRASHSSISRPKREFEKPWGKQERSLVAGMLLLTLGLALLAWMSRAAPQLSGGQLPKSLLSPETIEITNGNPSPTPAPIISQSVRVKRVIDGDTIVIEGGQKVRYIGIDAPEVKQCFWEEAKEANQRLVGNATVNLEKDVSETDQYGRLLRYVWVPSASSGQVDILVNERLVGEGYGHSVTYAPDVRYQQRLLQAQQQAQANGRGFWNQSACPQ